MEKAVMSKYSFIMFIYKRQLQFCESYVANLIVGHSDLFKTNATKRFRNLLYLQQTFIGVFHWVISPKQILKVLTLAYKTLHKAAFDTCP